MAATTPMLFSSLNEDNHGPLIVITAGITLGATALALAMRLMQRWPWTRLFKLDDALLIGATVTEIASVAIVASAVHEGLGKRVDLLTSNAEAQTRPLLIAYFALTFLTEGLAAISFVALLRNLDPTKQLRRILVGIMAVIAIWMVAAVLRFAVSGSPRVAPLDRGTWIGFAVVSILIQIVLFAASMWTIWRLQMPVGRKIACSCYLSLCVSVAIVTAIRLAYTPAQSLDRDFTWKNTNMIIMLIIESNLAIIGAALPSVRSVLSKVSTGFLAAETARDVSASGSNGASYGLNSIVKQGSRAKEEMLSSKASCHAEKHATVVKGDAKSDKSFGSQAIMIRRSVEIESTAINSPPGAHSSGGNTFGIPQSN